MEFGTLEDARRVVQDALSQAPTLSARERSRLSAELVADLRDKGLLAQCQEQLYTAVQAARLISRSPKYVAQQAKAGALGPVGLDDGGWLIPASGLQRWFTARLFLSSNSSQEEQAA